MALQLYNLLNNIEGDWISQRTIYYLKTKRFKTFHMKSFIGPFNILNPIRTKNLMDYNGYIIKWYNNKQIRENLYIFADNLNQIQKIEGDYNRIYQFEFKTVHLIKIISNYEKMQCIEYIHLVSQNFRISISLIKKLNKYIAIAFTSDIKIIKK